MCMKELLDLRDVWQRNYNKLMQVEMNNGDCIRGKLVIVDYFTGHRGIFRKITDLKEYLESNGLRGMMEITLLAMDVKSCRSLD
jgi:hypothetical protein